MTSGSLDYQLLIRLHNGRYIRRNYETMTMWFSPKRKLLLWKGQHKKRRMEKDMPSGKSVLALGKSEVSGNSERDWEIAGTQECTIQSLRETLLSNTMIFWAKFVITSRSRMESKFSIASLVSIIANTCQEMKNTSLISFFSLWRNHWPAVLLLPQLEPLSGPTIAYHVART